ncbi:DUF6615 family protein [Falsiroseomonas sp. E2-1-a4]|uniref:DUF6615 family protein n=1 Tax=Falsiroseomonas sp. E2-1-a4 TaxID=3239299 RepID=UPI003F3C87E1
MKYSLLHSLLQLAHATSQNLAFAHGHGVNISYGEETITETNLLELRRRHPVSIRLHTFGKKREALNGADWEWHIIGRARKLRMRVQAKRLQKDNKLKIPHEIASSKKQQIDLLIKDAKKNKLKPVYCIYGSEAQRNLWQKRSPPTPGFKEYEYGCLLVSAHQVKSSMPQTLSTIEANCIPWHFLVEPHRYSALPIFSDIDDIPALYSVSLGMTTPVAEAGKDGTKAVREFPTVDDLNAADKPRINLEGVAEATSSEFSSPIVDGHYSERGVKRLVEIDVRDISPGPEALE